MRLTNSEGIAPQVVELLGPRAVADVMPARGHQGHLQPLATQLVLWLRLKRVGVREFREGRGDLRRLLSRR